MRPPLRTAISSSSFRNGFLHYLQMCPRSILVARRQAKAQYFVSSYLLMTETVILCIIGKDQHRHSETNLKVPFNKSKWFRLFLYLCPHLISLQSQLDMVFIEANSRLIILIMGACMNNPKERQRACDCAQCQKCERQFLADLRPLHKEYVKLVLHVRNTRLFADRNPALLKAVHQYVSSGYLVPSGNTDIACVDGVRKLHPKEYWNEKVDEQWMIQACLRQQKFSDETRVESVTFDHAYPEYLQFLLLCKHNMKNGRITVPSKCQDIIWHSHMTDPENYKKDTEAYLGKLLNHMDDFPEEDLKKFSAQNREVRKQLAKGQAKKQSL